MGYIIKPTKFCRKGNFLFMDKDRRLETIKMKRGGAGHIRHILSAESDSKIGR